MQLWNTFGKVAVVAIGAYFGYGFYKSGWFTRPPMPPNSFSLSFSSGFRAILVDMPNEFFSREYIAYPADVPHYLNDAWSFCRAPTEEELQLFLTDGRWTSGERLDAMCTLDVDGTIVFRGAIVTVPRL